MFDPVFKGISGTPLIRLQNDMNRLFDGIFDETPAQLGRRGAYPGVNIWEDGDCAYLEAELPGLGMDDIEVLISGNDVAIKGQRKPVEQADASYHRRERPTGRFSRTLTLPWEVDANKVEAKLLDGILTVKLPKSAASKPKKVKLLTE